MKLAKSRRALIISIILTTLMIAMPATVLAIPVVDVFPPRGPVETSVTVGGTDFSKSSSVQIYYPDRATLKTTALTDATGYFLSPAFTIGTYPAGSRTIYVIDVVTGGVYLGTFTIIPQIALSTREDYVGKEIKVRGSGFAASATVTIYFDGQQVGTATTSSAGVFTEVTAAVPASSWGSHTIRATDTGNNEATATFNTKHSLAINPTSGTAGTRVTVTGTGFAADVDITITFAKTQVTTAPPSVRTGSNGGFTGVFNVPPVSAGSHQVEASDGTHSDGKAFTVSASVSLGQTSGHVGTEVKVSGNGFLPSHPVTVTFDNAAVATLNSGADGSVRGSFNVPPRDAGTYKVRVSDGSNSGEVNFSILTSADISPKTTAASPGHVGTQITINGIGFVAGRIVTISYEGAQVVTTTVKADGTFSATFAVPASRSGQRTVVASDGTITRQFTFFMEATPPAIPKPLKPEMDVKASAQAYFDWEDVKDESGVTYALQIATDKDFKSIVLEKKGLTKSDYTLTTQERLKSVSKKTPYYWHVRAVDGASNESPWSGAGSFHVGFLIDLTGKINYIFFGIGALLIGVLGFWFGRKTSYY